MKDSGPTMTPSMQSPGTPGVLCARCQRVWSLEAWRTLPTVVTLTGADVQDYVSVWPADAVVEVRACGHCGGSIARRRVLRSQ